jgi:hypothetical protein
MAELPCWRQVGMFSFCSIGVKPCFRALAATFQMRRDQFDKPLIMIAVMSGLVDVGEKDRRERRVRSCLPNRLDRMRHDATDSAGLNCCREKIPPRNDQAMMSGVI